MVRAPIYWSGPHTGLFFRLGCCAALCAGVIGASAQQREPQEAALVVKLVSAAQGRKIAAVTLEQDEALRGAQDCSHLVHQICSLAGYEYPYASSFDLYAGNGSFWRVRHAQAGDLITWPGHVGIVLDSRKHNFYSLVRSGLRSEDYLGRYWRSRGTPRFYRYVIGSGSNVETAKAEEPAHDNRRSSLRADGTAKTDMRAEAEKANEKHISEDTSLRLKIAPTRESQGDPTESIPASIVITSEQRRPTAAEAYEKILELSSGAANALHRADPFQVKTPIVILDELKVERVETKRDKGWLHLQIESHARIDGDGVDLKQRREKARWELRRDASGWVAFPGPEQFYVSRDVAVRELAAQLAEMTQSDAAAKHDETVIGQEARIANLLSALLQK